MGKKNLIKWGNDFISHVYNSPPEIRELLDEYRALPFEKPSQMRLATLKEHSGTTSSVPKAFVPLPSDPIPSDPIPSDLNAKESKKVFKAAGKEKSSAQSSFGSFCMFYLPLNVYIVGISSVLLSCLIL